MSEEQFHLDIVLDVKKPHWGWVEEMLGLYRSSVIYSNAKHKLISDRDDLPVRQVFHSGNIVYQSTRVVVGANDPVKPNEAKYVFANEDKDYAQDIDYAPDSLSVFAQNQNIKSYELNLNGITRPTEAYRNATTDIQKRRQKLREVNWATGLEAIVVEPGDIAMVGVPLTDYEAGFGGRALDGNANLVVLDREFTQNGAMTYDMWAWHTSTDTVESRRVNSWNGVRISVVPTSAFTVPVTQGCRIGIGITSEDLIRVRVLETRRNEVGQHELRGIEQIHVDPGLRCPEADTFVDTGAQIPSQPSTTTVVTSDGACTICVNGTFVSCQGGSFTRTGTTISAGFTFGVFVSSAHNQGASALVGDSMTVVSGVSSGRNLSVQSYTGAGSFFARIAAGTSMAIPDSGDSYRIALRAPAGLQVQVDIGSGFGVVGTVLGNSGCVDVTGIGEDLQVRAIPVSSRAAVNTFGVVTTSVFLSGCNEVTGPSTGGTITGSADLSFWRVTLPGSTLTASTALIYDTSGLVSEVCSPAEYTEAKFRLVFGGATLIDSLVVVFNGSSSPNIGSAQPFFVSGRVDPQGANPNQQIASMRYFGATHSGQMAVERAGTGAQSASVTNTFGIFVQFTHLDTAGAVHSHACFEAVFQRGELTVQD